MNLRSKLAFFIKQAKSAERKEPIWLEYLESDGSQYIDTGILSSYDYTVKIKYAYVAFKSAYNCIFGARSEAVSTGNTVYWVGCNSNSKELMVRMGRTAPTYTINKNEVYELTTNPNEVTINGTGLGDIMFDGEIGFSADIRLFGLNDSQSDTPSSIFMSSARIYSFQVYDKNMVLIQDLRPALDPNNVVCMYDMVSKLYLYNQGTGEFTAGSAVEFE